MLAVLLGLLTPRCCVAVVGHVARAQGFADELAQAHLMLCWADLSSAQVGTLPATCRTALTKCVRAPPRVRTRLAHTSHDAQCDQEGPCSQVTSRRAFPTTCPNVRRFATAAGIAGYPMNYDWDYQYLGAAALLQLLRPALLTVQANNTVPASVRVAADYLNRMSRMWTDRTKACPTFKLDGEFTVSRLLVPRARGGGGSRRSVCQGSA